MINIKRFVIISIITAVLMGTPSFLKASAAQAKTPAVTPHNVEVKLTDAQKNELKQLFNQKIDIEKKILQKYVDFGVIPKEQADKKLMRLDGMREVLEENGYMPIHKKDFKGHEGDHKQNNAE